MKATEMRDRLNELIEKHGDLQIYKLAAGSFFEPNIGEHSVFLRGCENEPYWTNSPEENIPPIGEKFLWL